MLCSTPAGKKRAKSCCSQPRLASLTFTAGGSGRQTILLVDATFMPLTEWLASAQSIHLLLESGGKYASARSALLRKSDRSKDHDTCNHAPFSEARSQQTTLEPCYFVVRNGCNHYAQGIITVCRVGYRAPKLGLHCGVGSSSASWLCPHVLLFTECASIPAAEVLVRSTWYIGSTRGCQGRDSLSFPL